MTSDLRDVVDVRALTPTQEGMLYHSLAEPDTDVYHSQVVSTLPTDLDVDRLRQAWEVLVDRHETLRTGFFWDGLDQPLQVVRPGAELTWEVADWSQASAGAVDGADVDARLERLLERDGVAPFALDEAPLARMRLIRRPDRRWTWVWTFHHMILDGWSVRILMRELSTLYRGLGSSLADPVSPRIYVDWLAAQDPRRSLEHWSARLADVTDAQRLELPGLPAGGRGHDRLDVTLPAAFVERLSGTATALRVTPSALVTAAWSLVVSAMSTSPDVVVGVTTSGRPPQLPGVEQLVGLFLNTLPLVSDVRADATVGEYVSEVHRAQLDLLEHQYVGLAEAHRLAGIRGGESLFESIVVFENLPPEQGSDGPGQFDELEFRERSNFPLALLATPGEGLSLRLVFDAARFSRVAADGLLRATERALEQLTVVDRPLSQLRLAAADADLVGPTATEATRTVVDQIAEVVRTRPGDTALATAGDEVTYGEMWAQVERLARRLARDGLGRGDLVGVMVPRSPEMIVAILGVQRAGAAYVPLDPGYPRAHLERIVDGAGVAAVVVDRSVDEPPRVGRVIEVGGSTDPDDGELPAAPRLDDVAYVIHTSGSTGRPKGVVVTHANLASSTGARSDYYDGPVGSFLLLSSASFDSSVAGIFWTLTTGGTLVLPDDGGERDVGHLHDLLDRRAVTHTLALPSLYRILAEEAGPLPDTLECVVVAGEAVDRAVVDAHVRASGARLFNEYGPTEGTVWATVTELRPDAAPGSIGTPIAGTRARIVDHLGNPVPRGFAGELAISGPGVVDGYLDDDATASSFEERDGRRWYRTGDRCVIDVDGEVVFLGRTDEQLKIRGYRIEPAEVEGALRASPGVTDAAVRATTWHGAATLAGYVVGDVDVASLEADLADRLPRHMVPGTLTILDRLPRLPNGKVDHDGLPQPGPRTDRAALVQPSSEAERTLAAIWAELLGHDEFGVLDDFFAIGGDSLQTIQMVSRARQAGLDVDMRLLLTEPTIRALAADLEEPDRPSLRTRMKSLVEIQRGDSRSPLVAVHAGGGHVFLYRDLARHLGESQTVYGLEPIGLDGTEPPIESIPEMAARYVDELREVQPEGPYRFVGYCMGGAVSLEMTRQLEEQGEEVELIVVVDSGLPTRPQRTTPAAKIRTQLARGGAAGLASFLLQRVGVRWRRMRDRSVGGQIGRDRVTLELVQRACRRAFQSYSATAVRAPISLIRSSEFAAAPEKDYHMRWGEMTSHLTTSIVDGRHRTILEEPTVARVADVIRSELQHVG